MDSLQYSHELEDDRTATYQCDFMDYIDEELAAILGDDFPGSLSPAGSDSSSSSTLMNIPQARSNTPAATEPPQNPNNFSNFSTAKVASSAANNPDKATSTPVILDFENAKSPEKSQQVRPQINPNDVSVVSEVYRNEVSKRQKRASTANKTRRLKPPSQTYDHIMAERKRREQLSQRFVALSAIVPGLKKMDKSSVLGDAIKYLKHLQDRVKMLEDQSAKQTVESVVLVKKTQIVEDEGSSAGHSNYLLPEIEARVCDKSILIKIHCEKRKGVLVKILAEIENLNLGVVNTSVTPFGSMALDITIIAEMDKEMSVAAKDIVKTLRSALQAAG